MWRIRSTRATWHGHITHFCLSSRCQIPPYIPPKADVDIRVDESDEYFEDGHREYIAFQDPDELCAAILAEHRDEAECYRLALCELLDKDMLLDFQYHERLFTFSKREYLLKDISNMCWRIDSGSQMLS